MLTKNTTYTIGSKVIILLINFALVILTTHIWGSGGRGEIALVIANVSIITIFSNAFCGGTISYHASKVQRDLLLTVSLAGAIIVSIAGAIIFSMLFGLIYFWTLLLISLLLSLLTAISSYWLGKNNIKNYNLLTLLNPILILIFLACFYFILANTSINAYFQAYEAGTLIVLIIGIAGLYSKQSFKIPEINFLVIKSVLNYGTNNEFNFLIIAFHISLLRNFWDWLNLVSFQ
jgi:O-antigen/teichoic acid export membrane protein